MADTMTGEQSQAARELLGWSPARLSAHAFIPESALVIFETTGRMQPAIHGSEDRKLVLRATFEAAGVEFMEPNGVEPTVRLKGAAP